MMVLSLFAVSFAYATSLRTRRIRQQNVMIQLKAQATSAARIALARIAASQADFDHPAQRWHAHAPLEQENWLPQWEPKGNNPAEFVAGYDVIDEEGKL